MSSYTGFDQDAPPAFRQGISGVSRLILFVLLSFALMGLDKRTDLGAYFRFAVRTMLDPVVIALAWPGMVFNQVSASWNTFLHDDQVRKEVAAKQLQLSLQVQSLTPLAAENAQLRNLLQLQNRQAAQAMQAADILSEAIDPFSQRIIVNKGLLHGVAVGSPVIDDAGLVGQVIEVYPQTSTVRTVADRNFAISLVNGRSLERSLGVGYAQSGSDIELRYTVAHDVELGDMYYTSGIDNVYPPNLAVGRVQKIDRREGAAFARILLKAAAKVHQGQQVMIVAPIPRQATPSANTAKPAVKK